MYTPHYTLTSHQQFLITFSHKKPFPHHNITPPQSAICHFSKLIMYTNVLFKTNGNSQTHTQHQQKINNSVLLHITPRLTTSDFMCGRWSWSKEAVLQKGFWLGDCPYYLHSPVNFTTGLKIDQKYFWVFSLLVNPHECIVGKNKMRAGLLQ